MLESLGEQGPHDSVTGDEQAATQQPQGHVELEAAVREMR